LVEGQQDYEVTAATFVNLQEVAIKDANGKYHVLTPVDRSKGNAQELSDLEATTGMPKYYDKVGNSILLFPKPSASFCTLTNGIQIIAQRLPVYFTDADTTKTPGFNPLFHRLLSLGAAIDYCIANGMSKKQAVLEKEWQTLNRNMMEHYAARLKDEQAQLTLQSEDYGSDDHFPTSSQFNL
jgi:hypothetical protein